nr:T9SS type A sorting domain-containing protein [Allomuricauda sp.]
MKKIFYILYLFLVLPLYNGLAQNSAENLNLREDWWFPNGRVKDILIDSANSVAYVGGGFQYVGPYYESGAFIDPLTGEPDASRNFVERVYDMVSDGNGGWYIAGSFSKWKDSVRNNLVHVDQNGDVTDWAPYTDRSVYAIERIGDTIIIGGRFGEVNGFGYEHLAAILTDGSVLNWDEDCSDDVNTIVHYGGDTIIVGGSFSSFDNPNGTGSTPRRGVAQIVVGGGVTSFRCDVQGVVNDMALRGHVLYVGGRFNTMRFSTNRRNLGAIDMDLALPTVFDPQVDGDVNTLEIVGNTIYIGGDFQNVGSSPRNRLAAVEPILGIPLSWNPDADHNVEDMIHYGGSFYIVGVFDFMGGELVKGTANVDLSGNVTPWRCRINTGGYRIFEVDNDFLVSGFFTSIGGKTRQQVAQIDLNTGLPTNWDPQISINNTSSIPEITKVGIWDSLLIVSRNRVGEYLVGLSRTTGAFTSWTNDVDVVSRDFIILDSILYFVGSFGSVNGQHRPNLGAISLPSGSLLPFKLNSFFGSFITDIKEYNGVLYLGGRFTSINGQTRNNAAAIDIATGILTPWNPNVNGDVNALAIDSGIVYIGGDFTTIGGLPRPNLGAVDTGGTLLNWFPFPDNRVTGLEVYKDLIYVSGWFNRVGTPLRDGFAELSKSTGVPTSWNPGRADNAEVIVRKPSMLLVGNAISENFGSGFGYFNGFTECNISAPTGDTTEISCQGSTLEFLSIDSSNISWYSSPIGGTELAKTTTLVDSAFYYASQIIGCESESRLKVQVFLSDPDTSYSMVSACDSFFWDVTGVTYYASTTDSGTINVNGCDSVLVLDISILAGVTMYDSAVVCDSFTWGVNNQTYIATGVYSETYTNADGCDSIWVLDLTINHSDSIHQVAIDCDSFFWQPLNQYLTTSGIYTASFLNVHGCDSILSIDLTINYSDSISQTAIDCDSFFWAPANQYLNSSGNYSAFFINRNGCDSIHYLDLVINNSSLLNTSAQICKGDTFFFGSQVLTVSGNYTEVFSDAFGCDSTVNLSLDVIQLDTSVSTNDRTLTSNAIGISYQWVNCDSGFVAIPGETNSSYTVTSTGNYAVVVSDGFCIDTSNCIFVQVLGLGETSNKSIVLYPNPANSSLFVELPKGFVAQGITVLNNKGYEYSLTSNSVSEGKLDISFLPPGYYILRVKTSDDTYDLKFIKN